MQYELKTQVIEPVRKTFTHIADRYGDRLASRYEEGTIDIQATENFHYRPQWSPEHELYDEAFSAFRLTDPYSFTDPRQYYYAPYVASRSGMSEAVAATLDYLEKRELLLKLPDGWRTLLAEVVVPLRHLESGAQMIGCDAARFGYGTSITQCASFAAFDRVNNAQTLSRIGIALADGTAELLQGAKTSWMDDPTLQPLRRLIEQLLVQKDWGVAMVSLDVLDRLTYDLLYSHLDEVAINTGAGAYSLLAQHQTGWFTDQRKWLDALYKAWVTDPELSDANKALLAATTATALDAAIEALTPIAAKADALVGGGNAEALQAAADKVRESTATLTA